MKSLILLSIVRKYALTSYTLSIKKVGKFFRFICYNTGWLGSVMGVRDGPAPRGEEDAAAREAFWKLTSAERGLARRCAGAASPSAPAPVSSAASRVRGRASRAASARAASAAETQAEGPTEAAAPEEAAREEAAKEREQAKEKEAAAKEKEVAAKEAKPGQKRKFEEVFSSTKKDRHQVSGFKSGKVEITEAQLKVLEGVFQTAVIPEPEQIKELCQTTSLPAQEITKWFVKKLNEESKKRLVSKPTGSAGKDSPKGKESKSKVKVIETFKDMTKDHKRALEDIFKANQNPSEEMLSEVSSKLKIDLNLLTKWFSLRGQQKK